MRGLSALRKEGKRNKAIFCYSETCPPQRCRVEQDSGCEWTKSRERNRLKKFTTFVFDILHHGICLCKGSDHQKAGDRSRFNFSGLRILRIFFFFLIVQVSTTNELRSHPDLATHVVQQSDNKGSPGLHPWHSLRTLPLYQKLTHVNE